MSIMKRTFFLISMISAILLTSCEANYWTGLQTFTFENKSSKTVYVEIPDEDPIKVKMNDSEQIDVSADTEFEIDTCYRSDLYCQTFGRYVIYDTPFYQITVHNNTSEIVVLAEREKMIGSYEELMSLTSSTTPLDDVNMKIEIPAGGSQTFKLYTRSPQYYAYFKDTEVPVSLALLSFEE